MKPVAIDLFCGKGGWTNALLEVGFKVYGFDIETQPDYKGTFIRCDILSLTADDIRFLAKGKPSFATCSSPCEQFSVHGMKCFHPNPKYPEMGVRLFNHGRSLLEELDVPYVMENVAAAERFVGKAINHCGSFYLWGTGVPAIFPKDAYQVKKGMRLGTGGFTGTGQKFSMMSAEEKKAARKMDPMLSSGSKSSARKAATALVAMIPLPIARAVAELAANLCFEGVA